MYKKVVYSNGISEAVFYDSVSGIEIALVLTESFDRYNYGVPVSIDYFSFYRARLYKLKEVPLNLLAFAYYVGEMLAKR